MCRRNIAGSVLIVALAIPSLALAQAVEWEDMRFATPAPPARSNHALTYDTVRGVTLLFGGGDRNDTWTWDGDEWTQHFPANSPEPRSGHVLAFDKARGKAVLFGGAVTVGSSFAFREGTWEWDGFDWSRVETFREPPPRRSAAMAYDEGRGVIVLWGSRDRWYRGDEDVWEFDGVAWFRRPAPGPELRDMASLAYDPERRVVVMTGGRLFGSDDRGIFGDTWEWDGSVWRARRDVTRPRSASLNSCLVYDEDRRRFVLHGMSTFEWDGVSPDWTPVVTASSVRTDDGELAYDSRRRRIVMIAPWSVAAMGTFELSSVHIESVSPPSGAEGGGDLVTLRGFGFASGGVPRVLFGGAAATVIDSSAERIRVRTPLGTGVVDVQVLADRGESRMRSAYEFLDATIAARYGNVGVGSGVREDVLFVNGSAGDARLRALDLSLREPIEIEMRSPSSRGRANYALYLWRGEPTSATLTDTPFGIGLTVFPTPISGVGGPRPRVVWNNIPGTASSLGAPSLESAAAPATVFSSARGSRRPMAFTLQGFIRDDASGIEQGLSTTNAIVVTVR